MTFDALIRHIYDGAADTTLFPRIAAEMSRCVGLDGATLILHTTDTQQVISASMVNYDHLPVDEIFGEYGREWHRRNPQVLFEREATTANLYFEGVHPLLNSQAMPDFACWREARLGIRSQITGYCRPSDTLTYAFAFSSDKDRVPTSRTQLRRLEVLLSHLRQAVRLAHSIDTLRHQRQALLDHLHGLPTGAILIDTRGRPVVVNAAADMLLGAHHSLRLSRDGLRAIAPQDEARLQRLLADALASPGAGGAMLIRPRAGEQPLLLQAAPLTRAFHHFALDVGAAIVTMTDWRAPKAMLAERFRVALQLTGAEATVAVHLMAGSLDGDIAEACGVAVSTVRSHIRAILDKADLRSKAELAHLLTTIAR